MAGTYEPLSNKVWTLTKGVIDIYENAALPGLSHMKKMLLLNCDAEEYCEKREDICKVLLKHIGIYTQSRAYRYRQIAPVPEAESFDRQLLSDLTSASRDAVNGGKLKEALCLLSACHYFMLNSGYEFEVKDESSMLENLIQDLLPAVEFNGEKDLLLNFLCHVLTTSAKCHGQLLARTLKSTDPNLRDAVVNKISQELKNISSETIVQEMIGQEDVLALLCEEVTREACLSIEAAIDIKHQQSFYPKKSPMVNCLETIVRKLAKIVLNEQSTQDDKKVSTNLLCLLLESFTVILKKGTEVGKTAETLLGKENGLPMCALINLKRSLLSTALDGPMFLLMHILRDEKLLEVEIIQELIQKMVPLAVECRRAICVYESLVEDHESDKDESEEIENQKDQLLPPWYFTKTINSQHPLHEAYQYNESVTIPGAKRLFLIFDRRCSTQYEYDKLIIYEGKTANGKKLFEFGGNAYGYGSISVLSSGWPKEPLVVNSDSVNFSFEMKSTRELSTPDRAVWGFKILVTPSSQSDRNEEDYFLTSLSRLLTSTLHLQFNTLYRGCVETKEEKECGNMLASGLLQSCIWGQDVMEDSMEASSDQVRENAASDDVLSSLRKFAESKMPPMRTSVEPVLKPEHLEKTIISAVVRHLDLGKTIANYQANPAQESRESLYLANVVSETYHKLHSLMRRLQTIAELENRWEIEVENLQDDTESPGDIFFLDYQYHESKLKDLAILFFLKGIETEGKSMSQAVLELRDKLEGEVSNISLQKQEHLTHTRAVVRGICERIDLLLHITVKSEEATDLTNSAQGTTRSLQEMPLEKKKITRQQSVELGRLLDKTILQIPKALNKKTAKTNTETVGQQEGNNGYLVNESKLLDDIFNFIGSYPEQAVAAGSFKKAALVRRQRSRHRIQALAVMKGVLLATDKYGENMTLVRAISSIVSEGPRSAELKCGGLVSKVHDAYSETAKVLVEVLSQTPTLYKRSICEMSLIPYTKEEEQCLIKSKLLKLLEVLCAGQNDASEEIELVQQSEEHRLAKMAWVSFKVVAHRCVSWEEKRCTSTHISAESSVPKKLPKTFELSKQVSDLLSKSLIRACQALKSTGSLVELLHLLTELSWSKLGKDILSQPNCISTLLSLLAEPRLSPKVILTVAKLCHVSLPLIDLNFCNQISLDQLKEADAELNFGEEENLPSSIVSLLLKKLGDFLVPPHCDGSYGADTRDHRMEEVKDTSLGDGKHAPKGLSLFIHINDSQSAQDVTEELLDINREVKIFPLIRGAESLEKISEVEKDLHNHRMAELATEETSSVFRKAIQLAENNFVVSLGTSKMDPDKMNEQKKQIILAECKRQNLLLAKYDPPRPFLSQQVASDLATELIELVQSLALIKSTTLWRDAIFENIRTTIRQLPELIKKAHVTVTQGTKSDLAKIYQDVKKMSTILSLLGYFNECIKVGSRCTISDGMGYEYEVTVNSPHNLTKVTEIEGEKTAHVEASRLEFSTKLNEKSLEIFQDLKNEVIASIQDLLIPDAQGTDSLSFALPGSGDGRSLSMSTARMFSEIRMKACKLLSMYIENPDAATFFLKRSCHAVDMLKCLSKDCLPADRVSLLESTNKNLKAVYRNGIKPSLPSTLKASGESNNCWNISPKHPPLKSIVMDEHCLTFSYHSESVMEEGLPRGIFVSAKLPFQTEIKEAYFEVTVINCGSNDEAGNSPCLAIGLSPPPERKDGNWSNPEGSILLHHNGRLVHYCGNSLLQWKSVKLDEFKNGDIIGIGWKKQNSTQGEEQQRNDGTVFVTINGQKKTPEIDNVAGGLYPVVHAQNRLAHVRANFGQKTYHFNEANSYSRAAEANTKQVAAAFKDLPFSSQEKLSPVHAAKPGVSIVGHRRINFRSGRTALKVKSQRGYHPGAILDYKLPNLHNCSSSGPERSFKPRLDADDSDEEDDSLVSDDDEEEDIGIKDSLNTLLVKAWESKVFPIIKRRFRNDTERNDGLEQIRGALALGMTDIARQTVEFLYEEIGGIPRTLNLPTFNDIKADMAKFTIEKIKRGDHVLVSPLPDAASDVARRESSDFATVSQLKTFGLSGEVLEVDKANQIIQVETYLQAEGILVRFWYPLSWLQKPDQNQAKGDLGTEAQTINLKSCDIHRELINNEFVLSRLYCRESYLNLLKFSREQCIGEAIPPILGKCNSAEATMFTSSILMLQDIDLENLQHLSNASLKSGSVKASLLDDTIDGKSLSELQPIQSLVDVFYSPDLLLELKEELGRLIKKATACGGDHLLELSDQICQCFQHPADFMSEEGLVVSDISSLKSTITFRNACCVLVTPKVKNALTNERLNELQVEVMTLQGNRIMKNGSNSVREIVQYPVVTADGSRLFEPVLVASDLLRVSHSGGGNEDVSLTIVGIPQEMPLAMAFVRVMLENIWGGDTVVPEEILNSIFQHLSSYLIAHAAPPLLKEDVFATLTAILRWKLNKSEKTEMPPIRGDMFASLIEELAILYEREQDLQTHSKYFCTLIELVVAAREAWKRDLKENGEPILWLEKVEATICNLSDIADEHYSETNLKEPAEVLEKITLYLVTGFSGEMQPDCIKDRLKESLMNAGGFHEDMLAMTKSPLENEKTPETVALLVPRWSRKSKKFGDFLAQVKLPNSTIQVHKLGEDNNYKLDDGRLDTAAACMIKEVFLGEDKVKDAANKIFQTNDSEAREDEPTNVPVTKADLIEAEGNLSNNMLGVFFDKMAKSKGEELHNLLNDVMKKYGDAPDATKVRLLVESFIIYFQYSY